MSTRTELLNGADFEGDEAFCDAVVNAIKNHFRASDPCTNMTDKQPGEILSDSDDDKLYHVGGESGYPCDEILQASRSCDVIPDFKGVDFYDACNGDYATIRGIDEPGLGHRLTVGLDETSRVMVICDLGDIDVDFGQTPKADPTLIIFNAPFNASLTLSSQTIQAAWNLNILATNNWIARRMGDLAFGNGFVFDSMANIELTDTNAEQAWVYIEPKINQTSTAGYVAVLVDVTETNLGDASAGAGYNALLDLRVAGTTQFGIQNDGKIMTNQTAAATTLGNVTDKMPIYDGTGTLVGYIPIYDAIT